MTTFAQRCLMDNPARAERVASVIGELKNSGIEQVRLSWCDQHGNLHGKTLMLGAVERALDEGVNMVGTLMLKDISGHTSYKVFEPDGLSGLPGFAHAANLVMLPDPASLRILPWASKTAWMLCQPWFPDATPVAIDTRRVLQQALAKLAQAGFGLVCGLEVEFHIYRIEASDATDPGGALDPDQAAWPGPVPRVSILHPGYDLLSEALADRTHAALRIVQDTAQGLGLPLSSLEIEAGPSQFEAVFDATDALTAADHMVLFRNGVTQALRRAGYHATFMCRPPFANILSSGWHLHQSLTELATGCNAFMRPQSKPGSTPHDAQHVLSPTGEHYLAGLLAHAAGLAVFSTPTINGYGRYRPHALAPRAALWGRDNRGAMLRVIGTPPRPGSDQGSDAATRIENRLGEPAANPYLYVASQIHAGLDGLRRTLSAPPASDDPYGAGAAALPANLGEALQALANDSALVEGFGAGFVRYMDTIKRSELAQHAQAQDPQEWERRAYFGRI
jgi:glutamine synthetase